MLRSSLLLALFGLFSLVSGQTTSRVVIPPTCAAQSCTSTSSPQWVILSGDNFCANSQPNCFYGAAPASNPNSAFTGVDNFGIRFEAGDVTGPTTTGRSTSRYRYTQRNSDLFGGPGNADLNYPIQSLTNFAFSFLRETPFNGNGFGDGYNQQFPVLRLQLRTNPDHFFGANQLMELILEPYYHFSNTAGGFPSVNTWTTLNFLQTANLRVDSAFNSTAPGIARNKGTDTQCTGTGGTPLATFAQWTAQGACLEKTRIAAINIGFGGNGPYTPAIVTYADAVRFAVAATTQAPSLDVLYDFSDRAAPTSGAFGDPQLVGFHGQSYQVHGIDGSIYNLISSPSLQVNAEFKFLSEGNCPTLEQAGPSSANTNCFSHPGSYLGAIGVLQRINNETHTVEAYAGDASHGFRSVSVDGQLINIGELVNFDDWDLESDSSSSSDSLVRLTRQSLNIKNRFEVSWPHSHLLVIKTPEFDMEFDNSDGFVNQRVTVNKPLNQLKSHGLIGQTWQKKKYKGAIKDIEGEVDDYTIDDNSLLGTNFIYNQFQY